MEATSQYLNMRRRELSEIDEGGQGDAATEEIDELNFLADKVAELSSRFAVAAHQSLAVQFGLDVLGDLYADLKGTARDIAERERNER